ncbi:MAG: YggS family pyridoxal phosphate-dependent enzyme [Gammaproteobacteria bacterium]|nr:MAG: YggS family pyridoxal phosphate-dependent enzyme [Gammaproteobacteria bacterium]
MPNDTDHVSQDGHHVASDISQRLAATLSAIEAARTAAAGAAAEVSLLAVSKKKPAAAVRSAFAAGQRRFGENYADEGVAKMLATQDLDIEWHFIGHMQSRRSRLIAEHFHWAQSVDRLKVAQRLSAQRPDDMAPLEVCIQYNPDGEVQKGGVGDVAELEELAAACESMPGLRLRGLMSIPAPRDDHDEQRRIFAHIHEVYASLAERHPHVDTLSMGMSGDMRAAIAEGATMVRIGTAIFGARDG